MSRSILVVEDDALLRSFLVEVLTAEGHRVESAPDGAAGRASLERDAWDLVITDLKMPGLDGLSLLRSGRQSRPETRWIVITAHGSVESAVDAMKAGATDYLLKPFRSPDELRLVVRRALREAQSESRISLLAEELGKGFPPAELIFLGTAMTSLRSMAQEVAPTTANVLLTGASGTGKEVLARVIHAWSPRHSQPFVAVNCAALTESLLESELFGHERGAFTGAVTARKGRFELADGGTLFLDEIGEIAPSVQVKLLRVLQERVVERVGGVRPVPVDVRVIAATNRDLKTLVAAGTFREDLFYRLNVFPVRLPTLSERADAILPLAEFFRAKYAAQFGKRVDRFTAGAADDLRGYAWPGNIRELQNVVERAVILARETIDSCHLSLESGADALPAKGALKDVERETIVRILQETSGNRRKAASELGISLRTLQYRLKEYGLS
jgi:DNA-binding NtrC family response regulator